MIMGCHDFVITNTQKLVVNSIKRRISLKIERRWLMLNKSMIEKDWINRGCDL